MSVALGEEDMALLRRHAAEPPTRARVVPAGQIAALLARGDRVEELEKRLESLERMVRGQTASIATAPADRSECDPRLLARWENLCGFIAGKFGLTAATMFIGRLPTRARARKIAWWIAYNSQTAAGGRMSYPKLARLSGHLDHTTVLYGVKDVSASPELLDIARQLDAEFSGGAK